MQNALRLAELLTNRLCHDLASPLGGMLGALDMVGLEPEALADAVEAGHALRRRFVLLRGAWSVAPETMDAEEFRALATGLPSGRRVTISVELQPESGNFGQIGGRLALNALLLASESLPRGGSVTVSGRPSGHVTFSLAGKSSGWPVALAAMLADSDAAWAAVPAPDDIMSGRGLQAPLTALLIHAAGASAALVVSEDQTAALQLDLSGIA